MADDRASDQIRQEAALADPGTGPPTTQPVVYAASVTGLIVRAYTINDIVHMNPADYLALHPAQQQWITDVIYDFIEQVEGQIVNIVGRHRFDAMVNSMTEIDRIHSRQDDSVNYTVVGVIRFLAIVSVFHRDMVH